MGGEIDAPVHQDGNSAPQAQPPARAWHQTLVGRVPLWRLLAIVAAVLGALPATRPSRDADIWWHVRLGDLIRADGVPNRELWSYPILGKPWHPTAWLTDVLLSVLHETGGWRAIVLFKVVVCTAILVLLYRQVIPRARAEISAPVYVIALATLTPFFTERPQLLSFVLVLVVAPWATRLATTGHWRWWPWVAITYLWCNLHGMWVLAPALMGLAAVSWAVQSRFSSASLHTLARVTGTALLAIATTAATPVGPGLTWQPLAVRAIAPEISEWQRTSLLGNAPLGFALLLLCLVACWAIASPRQSGLLVYCLGVIAFSFVAVRDVAPAALLLAPVAAEAAGAVFAPRLAPHPPSTAPRWLAVVSATVAATLLIAASFARPAVDPTIPWQIVHDLAALPAPKHVVADLSISGVITGEVPSASVALDTRVDNYSGSFTHRYLAMLRMGPGWHHTLAEADPDYVVMPSESGLREYLQDDRHWVVMTRDNGYVLLRPPS